MYETFRFALGRFLNNLNMYLHHTHRKVKIGFQWFCWKNWLLKIHHRKNVTLQKIITDRFQTN